MLPSGQPPVYRIWLKALAVTYLVCLTIAIALAGHSIVRSPFGWFLPLAGFLAFPIIVLAWPNPRRTKRQISTSVMVMIAIALCATFVRFLM
jgi:hypothetical protein